MVFQEGMWPRTISYTIMTVLAQWEDIANSFVGWRIEFRHLCCQLVVKGVELFLAILVSESC